MNGFVETEIGRLPATWQVQRLGEVFETQLGKMLSQKARVGNSPKPYLRNKNVQWGRIDISDMLYMDFDDRETKKFRLRAGDLLVCEGGEPGRAAIWNGALTECFYQKALHRLRPRDGRVLSEFINYWLRFSFDLQNLYGVAGASSTIAHLPEVQLKSLPIPVPPLLEQRKIAAVLGLVQQAIEQQERLIALTTELKKALLHKLFTEGLRGEPQKQTEIGPVPESWEVQTIQSLVDEGIVDKPMDGNHGNIHPKSEDYTDSGIPFVMASDLKDGTIDFSSCAYLRKEQADRLQKGFARPGDVLISHKATIGVTAIVPAVEHYVMLTPQVTYYRSLRPTSLDNRFLKCLFDSEGFQKMFAAVARDGSTRSYIGITKQRGLLVAYPGIKEQREIAEVLDTADRKIVLAKNRQRGLSDLFRTLLHQLMTAQIRVHDLDLDGILVDAGPDEAA